MSTFPNRPNIKTAGDSSKSSKPEYKLKDQIPPEYRQNLLEYSDEVAHLLFHRNIKDKESADKFFNFNYENLHDPLLLKDIDKAVSKILETISTNKKITIFSDYDADGIPGAVILNDFFKKIGYENFEVYIPHRILEGFGLNNEAIDQIADSGTDLIITIDCGISDVEQTTYANSKGLEVIITDHHEPHEVVPDAFAIINPKQKACQYPEKMLCGCSVVFKLIQALIIKGNFDLPKHWEKTLLDMVGIATLSDMVPLLGENRIFATYGLTVLKMSPRKGLHKLLNKTRTNQKTLCEDDIGFTITPRINAASRMGQPEKAFQMLASKDDVEAEEIVAYLDKINNERKKYVTQIKKEIKKNLKDKKEVENDLKIIVDGNPNWKPSLVGLVASSLSEEYNVPVFLWGRAEGKDLKGSCRAPKGMSVVDLMKNVPATILPTFGGHHAAGGFVLASDKVDFLEEELLKSFHQNLGENNSDINTGPVTEIDLSLNIENIDNKKYEEIQKLGPFGVENPRPLLLVPNLIIKNINHFGKNKEHLSINFQDSQVRAICFFKKADHFNIAENDKISLVSHLEKSDFGNRSEIRLRIVDILKDNEVGF